MKLQCVLALSLLFLFASCKVLGTDEGSGFLIVDVEEISSSDTVTFDILQRNVLRPAKCLTCHSSWTDSEADLLDGHRIVPGDADASLLFILVRTGAMPKAPFPAISSEQLEIVERYINDLD